MGAIEPILPGATLGVLGGGQLGRMFVMAAARMGYRTAVFSAEPDSPAAQVAHEQVVANDDDEDALRRFAARCDAVTVEFENVSVAALETIARFVPVRPGPQVLAVAQDRLLERAFLDRHGFACAPHRPVHSAEDATRAAQSLDVPAVLKRARFGYDGRGQTIVRDAAAAQAAWRALRTDSALCEALVDYRCELSVLVARSARGEIQVFGPIENTHVDHVLDLSSVPARVPSKVAEDAVGLASHIAAALSLEGLICVEMFVAADGSLLVNELAPRPHNSGHLTIEACTISQFEQQVRALCGLPLLPMTLRGPAAMANVLGDLWRDGPPAWNAALASSAVALHLYGKAAPSPGRKMGHLTALGGTVELARDLALRARAAACPGAPHPTAAPPSRTLQAEGTPLSGSPSELSPS